MYGVTTVVVTAVTAVVVFVLYVLFSHKKNLLLRCCCFHSFHIYFCCCSLSNSISPSLSLLVDYFQHKTHRTALVVIGVYTWNNTHFFLGFIVHSVSVHNFEMVYAFIYLRINIQKKMYVVVILTKKTKQFTWWDHSRINKKKKKQFIFWSENICSVFYEKWNRLVIQPIYLVVKFTVFTSRDNRKTNLRQETWLTTNSFRFYVRIHTE